MSEPSLYRDHLEVLDRVLAESLERAKKAGSAYEGVIFHAGSAATYHADDQEIVFHTTPHFRRWVPALEGPDHVVLARPGESPRVIRVRPSDYWYDTSPPPASYWEDEVELEEVDSFEKVDGLLGDVAGMAYVGNSTSAARQLGFAETNVEPASLLASLDWYRAEKTYFEVSRIEIASQKAAAGHLEGKRAFEDGATEREIHWAYLRASDQIEKEVPFETIVALDDKASILHYQNKRGPEAAPGRVLLLDAGASWEGYAADLTRTWVAPGEHELFASLVDGMDRLEQELVAMVAPGRAYVDLHLAAHRGVAELLSSSGIVRVGPDEAYARGLTRAFLPHGVGHHLGIQVHDVGGRQTSPEGGTTPPPAEHPFLRNTRVLEPGHVVTVEPGLYFIPLLLDPLRDGEAASIVDWSVVERLLPCGGIRIEDDVLCTEDGYRDLSRPLLPGPT